MASHVADVTQLLGCTCEQHCGCRESLKSDELTAPPMLCTYCIYTFSIVDQLVQVDVALLKHCGAHRHTSMRSTHWPETHLGHAHLPSRHSELCRGPLSTTCSSFGFPSSIAHTRSNHDCRCDSYMWASHSHMCNTSSRSIQ